MGKATILLATLALFVAAGSLYQSERNALEADRRQSERDEEILAREIARSGHNAVMSKARELHAQHPQMPLDQIVDMINGSEGSISRDYQGGDYDAWLVNTSPATISALAVGRFGDASHRLETTSADGSVGGTTMPDVLEVEQPSQLQVTFLESMAGYCSAIYLERILPDVDPENQPEPELVFSPGNNRDGAAATYSSILQPGTRMNFILAVDADYHCERRDESVEWDDPTFEYTRPALIKDVEDLSALQEGKYAMIQERPTAPGVWRIAFEDLVFTDAKLADVKRNGYGGSSWNGTTYGGTGWSTINGSGYYSLQDFGSKPDFSDQVIEIVLSPVL